MENGNQAKYFHHTTRLTVTAVIRSAMKRTKASIPVKPLRSIDTPQICDEERVDGEKGLAVTSDAEGVMCVCHTRGILDLSSGIILEKNDDYNNNP